MIRKKKIRPVTKEILEYLGLFWHTNITHEEKDYIAEELVSVSPAEAQAYYDAAEELYEMYSAGVDYVVERSLFGALGIPAGLVEAVRFTWHDETEKHWHLYGRFDFAGGIDGRPIKLIEFNADTPTSLFEIAVIQWLLLKYNNLDETKQFNEVWEKIRANFERLQEKNPRLVEGDRRRAPAVLFTSLKGYIEDENTVRILQSIAQEALCITDFEYADKVVFADEGIFKKIGEGAFDRCDYWFKLLPWEDIAVDEPGMMDILTRLIIEDRAVVLNPPWTVLMQSKAMMKILWDLYPNHPLLLETSFSPLRGRKQVEKPVFGREGNNLRILGETGRQLLSTPGRYDALPKIYQEYAEVPEDESGHRYQAGVFFSYEPCGLGFRRDRSIVSNESPFVGHIIE